MSEALNGNKAHTSDDQEIVEYVDKKRTRHQISFKSQIFEFENPVPGFQMSIQVVELKFPALATENMSKVHSTRGLRKQ